ncbi:MAG: CCA tRNA nucleotidyltransferase [Eubacteriales bacterium]|nr:CCA tRNA nucleotidyltransferase [Eubacteriales bacterium]
MHIEIPKHVEMILNVLEEAGFEAYAVGGCVRDVLLGRCPHDWDITTSALPEQVKELFHRTIDTGLQHGTVTVMVEKEGYEVTTYRVDGEYEDGRHPKEVTFTASLSEDLKRRDFTINAMAYNHTDGLVDLFGGKEDLENGIIRCVGDPMERFTEDALRIMRAVRFSAQLGFAIEEKTKAALPIIAPNLKNVSAERIEAELEKMLLSPNPDFLRVAYEAGITKEFLWEFDTCMKTPQNNPHHCFSVGEHILHSMLYVKADKVLRFAMLLHDIGKPQVKSTDEDGIDHFYNHAIVGEKMAKTIMRRLKMDNDTIYKVSKLIQFHDYWGIMNAKQVRKTINKIGEDLFPLLLEIKKADCLAQSDLTRKENLTCLVEAQKHFQEIQERNECVSLKTLAITGNDLIQLGMKPGKEIGIILHKLLDLVLEEPEKNTKECLLKAIADIKMN